MTGDEREASARLDAFSTAVVGGCCTNRGCRTAA
jgi:hypothetical protein